jgi:hypothetical protein
MSNYHSNAEISMNMGISQDTAKKGGGRSREVKRRKMDPGAESSPAKAVTGIKGKRYQWSLELPYLRECSNGRKRRTAPPISTASIKPIQNPQHFLHKFLKQMIEEIEQQSSSH